MEQNILRNASLKSTKKRQFLLYLLQKEGVPMTAKALHEKSIIIMPMNLSTVYRTLNTLVEKEILLKSTRQNGVVYFTFPKSKHSHHLVCTRCNLVIPIPLCPLDEWEIELEQKAGFQITDHALKFFGVCPNCIK